MHQLCEQRIRRAWCRTKLHFTVINYWIKIIFQDANLSYLNVHGICILFAQIDTQIKVNHVFVFCLLYLISFLLHQCHPLFPYLFYASRTMLIEELSYFHYPHFLYMFITELSNNHRPSFLYLFINELSHDHHPPALYLSI